MSRNPVSVYLGNEIAAYGFGDTHPFNTKRHAAFVNGLHESGIDQKCKIKSPVKATRRELELFHNPEYIDLVIEKSKTGTGFLDRGDTPAFAGVYDTTAYIVGSTLNAVDEIFSGLVKRSFVPIAGLHHASRAGASGFCVFNDCGIVIEKLINMGLKRIAYIDIDAHHGDGVFYAFEDDPKVIFADIHESGRSLFPGTGYQNETGKAAGEGKKINIEMPPGATDENFMEAWNQVESFVESQQPEFILMQCGADSVIGDPLTHLNYSYKAHEHAAKQLARIADEHCQGRMLAVGGGGYNLDNIKKAWTSVVKSMLLET